MEVLEGHRGAGEVTGERASASDCPNCGRPAPEPFCPHCGEQRIDGRDFSLRGYLGEALNVLTNVESNVLRSFALLVARPGHLTAEYFAGRRKRYLKPLQLFLFCNLIFFFAQPYAKMNTLTTPLYVHLRMLPYSGAVRGMVGRAVAARGISFDEYQERFDSAIRTQAKTLVAIMIPFLALALAALFLRPRRFFAEHLVFSTHFFSFFLLLLLGVHFLVPPLQRGLAAFGLAPRAGDSDLFYTSILLLIAGAYIFAALRRVYGLGRAWAGLKCLLLLGALMFILQFYRLALFFTAYYSV